MSTNIIQPDSSQQHFMANMLAEGKYFPQHYQQYGENPGDLYQLRMEMGKSISAPPVGFTNQVFSPSMKPQPSNFPETLSPTGQMNVNHQEQSADTGSLKMKWKPEFYEFERLDLMQNPLEINTRNRNQSHQELFSQSINQNFPDIPQRGHSQSLQYNSHQYYANSGGNSDIYHEMPKKLIQVTPLEVQQQKASQNQTHNLQSVKKASFSSFSDQYSTNPHSPIKLSPEQYPQQQSPVFFPTPPSSGINHDMVHYMNYENQIMQPNPYYIQNDISINSFPNHSQNPFPTNPQYYGMIPFAKHNSNPGSNYYGNSKKNKTKGSLQKRNTFNPRQIYMSQNPQPFFPSNYQQDPYQDNYMSSSFHYPGSPTKMNSPLNMKQILSNLLDSCRDQNGSRIIQQYFEKADRDERDGIFSQVIPHVHTLLSDMFGNYVIQKFLELGTIQQKLKVYEAMKGKIFTLSQHTYSCRVVQKALEEFKNNGPVQDDILKELNADILSLIEDQNGNHVIQKCIETIPAEKLNFIIEKVTEKIEKLPFHPFGCRVIQRILEYSTFEQTAPMLKKIMSKCLECCESQYGNYIMQHILEKGPHQEKETLLRVLRNNFTQLSLNKFASNVTEKSAIHGNTEFRQEIVEIITSTYHENSLSLVVLMSHPFGNYVIQRLFECSDKATRRKIYEHVMQPENLEEIKKTNFGKHVAAFIEKLTDMQRD